jgi:hypothetical protein
MPASGRGANLDTSRRIGASRPPAKRPPTPAPSPLQKAVAAPSVNLRAPTVTPHSGEPFRPAQQQAQRKVERAQGALAPEPTPHIPRLPNPTPAQAHAALQIAQRAQKASGKPAPVYWREAANDPRLRDYVATVGHYARAALGHEAAIAGRGMQPALAHAGSPAAQAQARREAVALGRRYFANAPTASQAPAAKDVGLPLFGLATVRVPGTAHLASGLSSALQSIAPGLASQTPETKFVKGALGDVKAIGTFPFVGGYEAINAAGHALTGDTQPAKQLASGVASSLEHGAVGELLQGHLSGAERAFREHPIFSALEAEAGLGVAGRAASGLARAAGSTAAEGGARGAIAGAASDVRPAIGLTSDAGHARQGVGVKQRSFSKTPHRKLLQQLADGRREPITDARGNPVQIKDRGQTVPVLKPSERQAARYQKQRANFESMRAVNANRTARESAAHAGAEATTRPGKLPLLLRRANLGGASRPARGAPGLTTVAELSDRLARLHADGTILSPDPAGFTRELDKRIGVIRSALAQHDELKTQGASLYRTKDDLAAARGELRTLEAARANKRVMAQIPQIVQRGQAYGRALNAADKPQVQLRLRPLEQVERSRLMTAALAHIPGVRHVTEEQHAQLEQQLKDSGASRTEQILASGRDPGRTAAHERAQLVKGGVELRQRQANARVAGLERRLAAKKGAARRSQGGGAGRTPEPMRRADVKAIRDLQGKLTDARAEQKGLKAEHAKAKQALRENPLPPREAALRHANGHFLSTRHIEDVIRQHGRDPATVGFLPHRIDVGRQGDYYQQFRPEARPNPKDEVKTGSLYQRGSTSTSGQAVFDELAAKGTMAARARSFDQLIQENGVRSPIVEKARAGEQLTNAEERLLEKYGGYMTGKEGHELADRLQRDTGQSWIPVRAFAAALKKEDREAVQAAQSPSAAMETAQEGLLNSRFVDKNDTGAHNVVLMPADQVQRLADHLQPAGELRKFAQLLNGPFRMAVLSQPRWLTGNFLEPFIVRLPLSGSGANLPGAALDMAAAQKLLKTLDAGGEKEKRAAEQIRGVFLSGRYVGAKGASIRRTSTDFSGPLGKGVYGAHVLRNLPVLKQLGTLLLAYPKSFFVVNRVLIENPTAMMALGKQFRNDIQSWSGSYSHTVLLGRRAVAEAAQGLVDTATQHRYAERYWELLGQYDGFNPQLKRMIQSYTPFLPWTLASMRFVYWTLPAHHTAAFTGLVKAGQSVMPEWERQHADLPPGTLRYAQLAKDGGYRDLAHYTPYDISIQASEVGDKGVPLRQAAEPFIATLAPQFSGLRNALEGKDPYGRELQYSGGKEPSLGEEAIAIGGPLAETFLPVIAQLRRLREGGGTAYANSSIFAPKVKPGSKTQSALNRTLNPFRETYLKGKRQTPPPATAPAPREEEAPSALQQLESEAASTEEQQPSALQLLESEGR